MVHYLGTVSWDKQGDRDKLEYLWNGNCLITQRCTLRWQALISRAAAAAEANRIQMCRRPEQKLLNNIPSLF